MFNGDIQYITSSMSVKEIKQKGTAEGKYIVKKDDHNQDSDSNG